MWHIFYFFSDLPKLMKYKYKSQVGEGACLGAIPKRFDTDIKIKKENAIVSK